MKRVLAWFLLISLSAMLFCGCGETVQNPETENETRKEDDPVITEELDTFYVAVDGDDTAPGSFEKPLATIAAARDLAALRLAEGKPATICLRGGDYYLNSGVLFGEKLSGTKENPLTIKSYEGETVNLYGGIRVDPERVKKVDDQAILSRVLDETARGKLMQIDLKGLVDVIPAFYSYGHTADHAERPMEVYVNGKALSRSRWPNKEDGYGYLRTTDAVHNEDKTVTIFYDEALNEHISKWSEAAKKDLYLFGFLSWDWTNEAYDAGFIDTATHSIWLDGGLNSYFDYIASNTRFYFFNLIEEIDLPGESYADRKTKTVYFYPEDDFSTDDIIVSTLTDTMLNFQKTKHVVIDGINFLYTRGNAVNAVDTEDFTLKNCNIEHTSLNAATFTGTNVTVSGCRVYDTSAGGFHLEGGDRKTLTSGESLVENCEIHAVNRDQSTYKPGIYAGSFGMVIRHNKLYDAVHEMIAVHTNDVLIEYNEIFNCVSEASDMGAIYFGRDPSLMGTVIRYNFFHDNGNDYGGTGQQSIFIDDGNTGAEIYGNLFLRASHDTGAIKAHGAQFLTITNNVFVDMKPAFTFYNQDWTDADDFRQVRWMKYVYSREDSYRQMLDKIEAVDFDSDLWHEHYDRTSWAKVYDHLNADLIAQASTMSEEEFEAFAFEHAPRLSNVLSGNVIINSRTTRVDGKTVPYMGGPCTFENNYVSKETGIFKNYPDDLSFTEEGLALVKESCPDFAEIPLAEMGLLP